MTREDFIKGVKEGTIADYEMIRYCEENILPYAKSDEERKNFLNDIIGSLLVEYITSKDTNDKRLWNAYNLINDHYENPIGDPCYGKVIGWQDGHIVLKEKDQQTEQEPQQKLIDGFFYTDILGKETLIRRVEHLMMLLVIAGKGDIADEARRNAEKIWNRRSVKTKI